jgi:hypothetical protein
VLAVKGWTPDVDGASPLVLSLDSGRAMVCAGQAKNGLCADAVWFGILTGPDCGGPNYNGLGWLMRF